VDGTAFWDESGRVELRYPAAAGDGRDGAVVLAGVEARPDVHATGLTLAANTTCNLAPGPGLRILRAQGRMVLSGSLQRGGTPEGSAARADMKLRAEDHEPGRTALTHWLEEQISSDPDWTVIIAGGDLVIDGTLKVDTPLLLVAGGQIRAIGTGSVSALKDQTWLLGGGGGWSLYLTASPAELLFIDAPLRNELRLPLRYAVVSQPVPNTDRISRWISVEADGRPRRGHESAWGSWSVRYLSADHPSLEAAATVDHPDLLPQVQPVKIWIELEVRPGPLWEPPFVDYVLLRWEEKP
jgi:hypothetical protein